MPSAKRKSSPSSGAGDAAKRTYSILLVDDHELLRRGLRTALEEDASLEVCGEAGDLTSARKLIRKLRPDVVIVDLKLGSESGLDLIKFIKNSKRSTRVLVCSMHEESQFGQRVLQAGGNGYVSKNSPITIVIEAIHRILGGKLYFSEEFVNRMLLRAMAEGESMPVSPIDQLSDRELEVFRLLGQGRTTRDIAQQLHLSASTIDTYRERLKTKLGLSTGVELIHRATQWVLENE